MILTELFNHTQSLTELAPGGSGSNGPFDYGAAIIKIGETFVDHYADSAAGEDAAMIIAVGETFMNRGMMPGIKALFELDTQVYDHVLDELADEGFNVEQDIIAQRRKIPRDPEAGRLFAKARTDWEAQAGDVYQVTGLWGTGSSVGQDIKARSEEEARQKFLASNPEYKFKSVDVKRRGGAAGVAEKIDLGPKLGSKRDQGKILRKWRRARESEHDVAEAMKPSDIPPTQRQRLTMRDIEAERPGTVYRVQDPRPSRPGALFTDRAKAERYAANRNATVEVLPEDREKTSARIERILKMLRARHPQAENDLEALILDFRTQQAQDRSDIVRLDQENDMEEADIARLEQMLTQLRRRRSSPARNGDSLEETKKKPQPTNPELWSRAKAAARSKFDVYPSAYANAWAAKWYKSKGGGWRMGKPKKKD